MSINIENKNIFILGTIFGRIIKLKEFELLLKNKISETLAERDKFTPRYDVEWGILSHKAESYIDILNIFHQNFQKVTIL